MNNLSSYWGLVDAKIRASDKDLPTYNKSNLFKFSTQDSDLAHFVSRIEVCDKKLPLMGSLY